MKTLFKKIGVILGALLVVAGASTISVPSASADTGTHKYCLSSYADSSMRVYPNVTQDDGWSVPVFPGECYTRTGSNAGTRVMLNWNNDVGSWKQAYNKGPYGACHTIGEDDQLIDPPNTFDSTGIWYQRWAYYNAPCTGPII